MTILLKLDHGAGNTEERTFASVRDTEMQGVFFKVLDAGNRTLFACPMPRIISIDYLENDIITDLRGAN